jgi:hypothetical protein
MPLEQLEPYIILHALRASRDLRRFQSPMSEKAMQEEIASTAHLFEIMQTARSMPERAPQGHFIDPGSNA